LLPMAETSFLTGKSKRMNITTIWSNGQVQTLQKYVQSAAKTNTECAVWYWHHMFTLTVVLLAMLSVAQTVQWQTVG
jgi:hypothetical protein